MLTIQGVEMASTDGIHVTEAKHENQRTDSKL